MDPTLTVLAYSAAAAACAGLGAIPLYGRKRLPTAWIGWANALAAGFMLGAAYSLVEAGPGSPALTAVASILGVGVIYWTHAFAGTDELDLNRVGETPPEYAYKVLLVSTLHSSWEGIAIGAAMAVNLPFGIFVALAIALHNIPEGTVLTAILTSRGAPLRHAAVLAVLTDGGQVVLAVAVFAVVTAAPAVLPVATGFAVGALIYLVMVELIPECYRQAGHTSIAVVASVSMCLVALFHGILK